MLLSLVFFSMHILPSPLTESSHAVLLITYIFIHLNGLPGVYKRAIALPPNLADSCSYFETQ